MREFDSFEDFVDFIETKCAPAIPHALHNSVESVAERVLSRTKDQIGHYLSGPEPGLPTAPLSDATVGDRITRGFTPDDPGYRTGDMRDNYEKSVSPAAAIVEASVGSNDDKAVYFELGTSNQPPRPELLVAAMREEDFFVACVAEAVGNTLAGLFAENDVVTKVIPLDGSG